MADKDKEIETSLQCNLYNPTPGRRVIFDKSMKAVTIDSGDTKYNVALSRQIAEELRDRNRVRMNSDLIVSPGTEAPLAKAS
jgi:hypothetical protein